MQNKSIKDLVDETTKYAGTQRGNEAKLQYDMLKLEEERRRNKYAFINMILLSIIALANLIFVYLKYTEAAPLK